MSHSLKASKTTMLMRTFSRVSFLAVSFFHLTGLDSFPDLNFMSMVRATAEFVLVINSLTFLIVSALPGCNSLGQLLLLVQLGGRR